MLCQNRRAAGKKTILFYLGAMEGIDNKMNIEFEKIFVRSLHQRSYDRRSNGAKYFFRSIY